MRLSIWPYFGLLFLAYLAADFIAGCLFGPSAESRAIIDLRKPKSE
jgi:hypothetical protein